MLAILLTKTFFRLELLGTLVSVLKKNKFRDNIYTHKTNSNIEIALLLCTP